MNTALSVLMLLSALGAFDTLYYHEWHAAAASELYLRSMRDFAYTIIFGTMAWTTWNGLWVWPLAAILLFGVGNSHRFSGRGLRAAFWSHFH